MSSVTVYSIAKIEELLDAGVVGASIVSGHLHLEMRDGTTVDAGSILTDIPTATDTVEGAVELATDAETITGADGTRAVTPLGLSALMTAVVTSLNTVKTATGLVETALATAYPVGYSIMVLTASAWSLNSGSGTVLTNYIDNNHCTQSFYATSGGTQPAKVWTREYHSTNGGGGWTAWEQVMMTVTLTASSYVQTTAFTSYPAGYSRLYYTTAAVSWDFTGSAGEVITFVDGTDFARQTFTKHVGGSSAIPEVWTRTANAASGWTPWRRILTAAADSGNPKAMAWGNVNITPVTNTVTSVSVTFPAGRFTSTPTCIQVTANTSFPGTSVTEVSASNVTATGMDLYIYRSNTTATNLWWLAIQ